EPIATAVPPRPTVSSNATPVARPSDGLVPPELASTPATVVTTTYPVARRPTATGTVQSRSPSASASASGPWVANSSPSRRPVRHTTQALSRVRPSGTAVIATPSTVTPEPCETSHARAPARRPSRGEPWAPASVTNQPTTPTPIAASRVP